MGKGKRMAEGYGPRVATGPYPALMSIKDCANFLNVSRSTLRRLVVTGQIPFCMVGTRKRFDPMAVRAAIEKFI